MVDPQQCQRPSIYSFLAHFSFLNLRRGSTLLVLEAISITPSFRVGRGRWTGRLIGRRRVGDTLSTSRTMHANDRTSQIDPSYGLGVWSRCRANQETMRGIGSIQIRLGIDPDQGRGRERRIGFYKAAYPLRWWHHKERDSRNDGGRSI